MNLSHLIENFSFKGGKNADINYLSKAEIGEIIVKGLTETYLTKPDNPVKFLATWLQNEHNTGRLKEARLKLTREKEEHSMIHKFKLQQANQKQDEISLVVKRKENEKEQLINYINNSKDLEEELFYICDEVQKKLASTGVYIYLLDKKRKLVQHHDDEFAHEEETKVYRVVAYNSDHSFMKGKYVEKEGVTNDIYNVIDEPPKDDLAGGDEVDGAAEVEKEQKFKLVEEVVREPRIKFFREPRLGCYLAIDLSYKSSFYEKSLENSIEKLKEFYEEERIIEEERQARLDELKGNAVNNLSKVDDLVDDAKDVSGLNNPKPDGAPNDSSGNAVVADVEEKKAVLKEFWKDDKFYVIALDTLGQDRVFTSDELEYLKKVAKTFVQTISEQEKSKLLIMRDLRIKNITEEKKWMETANLDKLGETEEVEFKKFIAEKYDHPISDEEKEKEYYWFKSRYILKQHIEADEILLSFFLSFSNYEFVEHERVFQNLLYFAEYSNIEINYPETNKLCWKKAKKLWSPKIIKALINYEAYGPKPQSVTFFLKVNRLIKVLSEVDEEKVKEYSYVLGKLLEVFKLSKFSINVTKYLI